MIFSNAEFFHQDLRLLFCADGGIDLGAYVFCELHGSHTKSSSGRLDEHGLSFLEMREMIERIDNRHKDDRHGCNILELIRGLHLLH